MMKKSQIKVQNQVNNSILIFPELKKILEKLFLKMKPSEKKQLMKILQSEEQLLRYFLEEKLTDKKNVTKGKQAMNKARRKVLIKEEKIETEKEHPEKLLDKI